MRQWYCIVGSQRYGPMAQEQLAVWMSQGRVRPGDLVWAEGMPNWAPAGSIGELSTGRPGFPPIASPLQRHRGGTILALGIVSIVMGCLVDLICGIIGLKMANKDQIEINAGRMDPEGRALTQAGRICCIIGVVLGCFRLVIGIIYLAVFATMMSTH